MASSSGFPGLGRALKAAAACGCLRWIIASGAGVEAIPISEFPPRRNCRVCNRKPAGRRVLRDRATRPVAVRLRGNPGAIRRRELGLPVGNLAAHRDDITRALNVLITGF